MRNATSMDGEGVIGRMVQLDINKKVKVFAVRNAMPPSFVRELTSAMENVLFMQFDSNGKSQRRIQIVSEKYSKFLVSRKHNMKRYASARERLNLRGSCCFQ